MLCKGFYEEGMHEIMLWDFFGTTKNIMLWKIMLGEGLLYYIVQIFKTTKYLV